MKTAVLFYYKTTGRILWIVCFLLFCSTTRSQLCQGSLGDPIVNITFGRGLNPGPALAAVQGSQYQAADCPNDGFYSLRNSSTACFGSTWHTIASDHTGDGNGYFMLINGSYQPSVFYLDTVKDLCANTTYEFAAWVMNIQKPSACNGNIILPNLTFSIEKTDGTILQSYNTNDINALPFASWKQYGFFFTTSSGVSNIVLRITNNAPGGCGNDIALDDITFRPCGPQVTAATIGSAADTVNLRAGTTRAFQFTASVSGSSGNLAYQWQQRSNGGNWADIPGATTTTYGSTVSSTTAAGVYEYRLGTANAPNISTLRCRIYSKPLKIFVNAIPVVVITPSGTAACNGKAFLLKATGGDTYSWNGPNSYTSTDSVIYFSNILTAQNGLYTITAMSNAGCVGAGSFTITVNPSVTIKTSFLDTTVCQKAVVQLAASGGDTYQWSPATRLSSPAVANPTTTALDTIRYRVVTANSFGCTDTAFINLNVIKLAVANAGADKTIVSGVVATLDGSIKDQYQQFYWQPASGINNATLLQPQITSAVDAVYWLTAISPNGCGTSTDTVFVKVYKDIYIPSAFTPNGDGKNDLWAIPTLQAFTQYELLVYNRFGQLVFQTKNQYKTWNGIANGTPLPAGAYVYFLNVPELKKIWKGTVMMIR